MPSDSKRSFSSTRSCETSNASAGGRTGQRCSSARAVLAGTASHSYVTTRAPSAARVALAMSSSAPTTTSPTARAGATSLGSRNRNDRPSGIPAKPSMRPSCPPPNTVTVAMTTDATGRSRSRLQCQRRDRRVDQRMFVAPERVDLVERSLERAVARCHQGGVFLGDLLELQLHAVQLRGVLLPLP